MFLIFFLFFFAFTLIQSGYVFAIVNIEKVRASLEEGFLFNIDFMGTFKRGNVERTYFLGRGLFSYKEEKSHVFLLLNGTLDLGAERSFLSHLRYVYNISRYVSPEFFVQYEYNQPLLIVVRALGGVGLRFLIFEHSFDNLPTQSQDESPTGEKKNLGSGKIVIFFGSSYMPEYELYKGEKKGNLYHRISSYISFVYDVSRFSFSNVSYFQPRVDVISDIKILNESSLSVKLNENLSLNFLLTLRYDSTPPSPDLKTLDLSLIPGISIQFKM